MLWNDDLLFIHVPKTGGMATTKYLLDILEPPIFISVPEGHAEERPGLTIIDGKRHERLDEAATLLAQHGRTLASFKIILAGIRNPYDLEISRFGYLQKGHPWDKGKAQDLALAGDFDTFVCEAAFHGKTYPALEEYYEIGGRIPENLRLIRQEHIDGDMKSALAEVGIRFTERLPVTNVSEHGTREDYLTAVAERAIYDRFRWFFDHGYYERAAPARPREGFFKRLVRSYRRNG
ncbi:hypothetical protein [Parvibaculum sp.]|jgi:hypothetical protein|uniref:hypothetical protein n=1 Tax=Parvibaculum sp. TaxID=2024848 RepID=UPI001B18EDA5|nr:hypothetical protein [Parvibaculum sp.]MBO6634002.1 hypothetical protein [Parvibaculum sp.]MBO6680058.1 hypothetical protein [Parvibaculum sp.]MBO6683613.1 hypothetical protein [Parvibaculum sp.]MBO6904410.1 hypothetical protein [Parvibaculum sp.]